MPRHRTGAAASKAPPAGSGNVPPVSPGSHPAAASSRSPPGRPRGKRGGGGGSLIDLSYGRQRMKAFPLTEDQLGTLAHISAGASLFLAAATFFFGLAIDI